jgi:hypothetical protein
LASGSPFGFIAALRRTTEAPPRRPAGRDPRARHRPELDVLPLQLSENASRFWIMLLLIPARSERRVIVAWLLGLVAKLGGPYGFDGKLIDGL